MRILVTRPMPDGERTVETLRARGHEAVLAPLMRVEVMQPDFGSDRYAALLFTSANAPRALAGHPRRAALAKIPAFAVGHASTEAARAAGFEDVQSANGDASDLLRLVVARIGKSSAPLLYLAGEDRAGDLAGALAEQGLTAKTAVVYRAVAAPFPAQAAKALSDGTVDGVLHFSRRSASLYVEGASAAGLLAPALRPKHYCFAAQTADVLKAAGASQTFVAARPQESALLSLIGQS